MIEENENAKALKDKAERLTKELAEKIYDKGVTEVYNCLGTDIQATIEKETFFTAVRRIRKDESKNLGNKNDSEKTLSLRISRSQIMIHRILAACNIDERKFFNGDSEVQKTKKQNPFNALRIQLQDLEEKMDYIVDCVEPEQRKSVQQRFNELFLLSKAMEIALKNITSELKKESNISYKDCVLNLYFSLSSTILKLRKNNKIYQKILELAITNAKNNELFIRSIFTYTAIGLLLFINQIREFKSGYERTYKKNMKVKNQITPEQIAILIEDDNANYKDFAENRGKEEEFMNLLEDMESNLFQILDKKRVSKNNDALKTFCTSAYNMFNKSSNIFFNEKVQELTNNSNFWEVILRVDILNEKNNKNKYLRLFITKARYDFMEELLSWTEMFLSEKNRV